MKMDLTKVEHKLYYSQLLDIYGSFLTAKQYECMQLYYQEDYSLQEIAEIYDITRVAVHNQIQNANKKMDKFEQELQLHQIKNQLLPQLEENIKEQKYDVALQLLKQMK